MEKLSDIISMKVLTSSEDLAAFLDENIWLDKEHFGVICKRFGFPEKTLTVVVEKYYIDAAYRNMYYNYWSIFHFNWPRFCRRIFLFLNMHREEEFFAPECKDILQTDFLGVVVVRPAYSEEKDHTFGRTLLDPSKMVCVDECGNDRHPFLNVQTAEYKLHLLGNIYKIRAFPFSSQDGMVMKCAETAVYTLCDFKSARSPLYARVLPSDIQEKLKMRLPERVFPSHGLYNSDISYLLKEFGFSPMIYADNENIGARGQMCVGAQMYAGEYDKGGPSQEGGLEEGEKKDCHPTEYKDWFRYYVESSIPLIAITAPNQEVYKHASLVIGRGLSRKPVQDCKMYLLGELKCIDTTELYEDYIVQDDNQIPYCLEKMDRFTQRQNYKLEAFIVPLDRHVFLSAASAISIIDECIADDHKMIRESMDRIVQMYKELAGKEEDLQEKQNIEDIVGLLSVEEDNPIAIRYYLADSADYKMNRFLNGVNIEEKRFYAGVPMPKSVWVAELSTYKLYKEGYAFAEMVLDATASERSGVNSIILTRTTSSGLYRLPDEEYNQMTARMEGEKYEKNLAPFFPLYKYLKSDEWDADMGA